MHEAPGLTDLGDRWRPRGFFGRQKTFFGANFEKRSTHGLKAKRIPGNVCSFEKSSEVMQEAAAANFEKATKNRCAQIWTIHNNHF